MDTFKEQLVTNTNKTAYNASKVFMGIFGVLGFFFLVTGNLLFGLFFALGCGQRVSVVHESMAHHSLGMDFYRFD